MLILVGVTEKKKQDQIQEKYQACFTDQTFERLAKLFVNFVFF